MKSVTETWNGLREFPVTGRYFELISTVNPVDVTIYGKGDVVLARLVQIEEGVYHDRQRVHLEAFERIEITTGANEAVKFFVGDGITSNRAVLSDTSDRVGRLLGIIASITAPVDVSDRAARLLGIIASIAATVNTQDQGHSYGVAFDSSTNLLAGGAEGILAAASNTAGVRVVDWQNLSHIGSASLIFASLHAHTASPAAYADGDVIAQTVQPEMGAANGLAGYPGLPSPVRIVTGRGLWKLLGVNNESNARHRCLYTLD